MCVSIMSWAAYIVCPVQCVQTMANCISSAALVTGLLLAFQRRPKVGESLARPSPISIQVGSKFRKSLHIGT